MNLLKVGKSHIFQHKKNKILVVSSNFQSVRHVISFNKLVIHFFFVLFRCLVLLLHFCLNVVSFFYYHYEEHQLKFPSSANFSANEESRWSTTFLSVLSFLPNVPIQRKHVDYQTKMYSLFKVLLYATTGLITESPLNKWPCFRL